MSFLTFCSRAQPGQDSLLIKGCLIADSSHEGITGAYIKISCKQRPAVLAYVNSGKSNCFSIKVPFTAADTFFITASHIIYQSTTLSRYISVAGNSENIEIVMPLQKNVLGEVVIKTPPIWTRGDTTFFNARFFTEGEEKKLKDLIVKMPGFEIDADGNLLYRKQRVEKILLAGEEIFADRVKLLLNSIPVHVLNTVQALENQSDNKLLKGLTADNKVFLNLGIKKEKLKAAFGDGEAGAGLGGRYLFAPTLFALQGKAKIGFIGNENSTGSGFDWGEENELKNDEGKETEEWMMNDDYRQTVNNFGSKRYISNQKWDNRFQLNIPISRNVNSKTEIALLKDRQAQNTYYNSTLYNDSFYFKRADSNAIRHQPLILSARQELTWNISASRELKTSFQFYYNGADSRHAALYKEDFKTYAIENNTHTNLKSFSFHTAYTSRSSASAATRWFLSASSSEFEQTATGLSDDWVTIFQLGNKGYKNLSQVLTGKVNRIKAGMEVLKKTRAGLLTTGFEADWSGITVGNTMTFSDPDHTMPPLKPGYFNNGGHYYIIKFTGQTRQSLRVWGQPLFLNLDYGVASASLSEIKDKKTFITPVYSFEINQHTKTSRFVSFIYSLKYAQKQAELRNLYRINLPTTITSFHRNANTTGPVKALTGNVMMAISWGNFTSSFTNICYTRNFSGFAGTSTFDQLLRIGIDSLVQRPTDNFFASNTIIFPSLWLKAKFELAGGYSINKGFLIYRDNLLPVNYHWYHLMVNIKRNWHKKYFITLSTYYSTRENRLPNSLAGSIAKKISDLRILLKQRVVPGRNISLVLNTEWYNYNLFTGNRSHVLFADLECTYKLPGKPWSFSASFSNITNQRFFYSENNSPLIQSFYSFPLIERNLFLSARYEL